MMRNSNMYSLAIAITITISLSLLPVASAVGASTIRDRIDDFQRYDLDGNKVESCLCLKCDADDACDWDTYSDSLTFVAGIGVIIGIFFFVSWPMFHLFRRFCNCCGGTEPSNSRCLCFVDPKTHKFKGYKAIHVAWLKGAITIFLVMVVVLCVLSWVHSAIVTDEGDNFTTNTKALATQAQSSVVYSETVSLRVSDDFNYTERAAVADGYGAGQRGVTSLVDQQSSFNSDADTLEQSRVAFLNLGLIFTVVVWVTAAVGAVMNRPLLARIASEMGFLAATFSWIGFGFAMLFAFVAADICTSMDQITRTVNPISYVDSSLGAIFDCDSDTTIERFELMRNVTEELRRDLLYTGCDVFQTHTTSVPFGGTSLRVFQDSEDYSRWCLTRDDDQPGADNMEGITCQCENPYNRDVRNAWQYCELGEPCESGSAKYQRVYRLIVEGYVGPQCEREAVAGSIRVRDCVTDPNCRDECAAVAAEVIAYFDAATEIDEVLDNHVKRLSQCSFLQDLIDQTQTDLCVDLIEAADVVSSSVLVLGILYFLGLPALIMAVKRYNRQYWAAGYIPKHKFGVSASSTTLVEKSKSKTGISRNVL